MSPTNILLTPVQDNLEIAAPTWWKWSAMLEDTGTDIVALKTRE
ncbi:hypothetical protein P4594_28050 [Priestia megaterium]|nr:hypothetical protein [Priestia megaterium]